MVTKSIESILEKSRSATPTAEVKKRDKFKKNLPNRKLPLEFSDEDLEQMSKKKVYGLILDDLDEMITVRNKMILEHWRSISAENENIYQNFLITLGNLDKTYGEKDIISDIKFEAEPVTKPAINIKFCMIIAASLLFIFSLYYYVLLYPDDTVVTTDKAHKKNALPDGTNVYLNTEMSIKYSERYLELDRKLKLLTGEVVIQVFKHNGSRFHIILDDLEGIEQ